MCSKFCNGNSSNIVGYTPPTLHKGVRWFVDFKSSSTLPLYAPNGQGRQEDGG